MHRIVDELPESDLKKVLHHLEMVRAAKRDPFVQMLMDAPIDDEPSTPEEDAGAAEAWQEYRRSEARPWKEVRSTRSVTG